MWNAVSSGMSSVKENVAFFTNQNATESPVGKPSERRVSAGLTACSTNARSSFEGSDANHQSSSSAPGTPNEPDMASSPMPNGPDSELTREATPLPGTPQVRSAKETGLVDLQRDLFGASDSEGSPEPDEAAATGARSRVVPAAAAAPAGDQEELSPEEVSKLQKSVEALQVVVDNQKLDIAEYQTHLTTASRELEARDSDYQRLSVKLREVQSQNARLRAARNTSATSHSDEQAALTERISSLEAALADQEKQSKVLEDRLTATLGENALLKAQVAEKPSAWESEHRDSVASRASRASLASLGSTSSRMSDLSSPMTPRSMRDRLEEMKISNELLREEQAEFNEKKELSDRKMQQLELELSQSQAKSKAVEQELAASRSRHERQLAAVAASAASDKAALEQQIVSLNEAMEKANEQVPQGVQQELDSLRQETAKTLAKMEHDVAKYRSTAEQAKAKLTEQVKANKTIQDDMRLMYKKNKKDIETAKRKYKSGDYERRYVELLSHTQGADTVMDQVESMLNEMTQVLEMGGATGAVLQEIRAKVDGQTELARRNGELQRQVQVTIERNAELQKQLDAASAAGRTGTARDEWTDAGKMQFMDSPFKSRGARSSLASIASNLSHASILSDFDLPKQLEMQKQVTERLQGQLDSMVQRQQDTDAFVKQEREIMQTDMDKYRDFAAELEILERDIRQLQTSKSEVTQLLEEKNQIITVFEESMFKLQEDLETANRDLAAQEAITTRVQDDLADAQDLLEREKIKLKKQEMAREQERQQHATEMQECEEQRTMLQEELESGAGAVDETTVNAMEREMAEMRTALEESKQRADKLQRSLVSETEQTQGLREAMVDLQESKQAAQDEITKKQQAIDETKQLLRSCEEEVERDAMTISELESAVVEREEHIASLDKKIATLEKRVDYGESKLRETNEAEDQLRAENDELKVKLTEQAEPSSELMTVLEEMEKDAKQSKATITDLTREKADLADEMEIQKLLTQTKLQELTQLQSRLDEVTQEWRSLQETAEADRKRSAEADLMEVELKEEKETVTNLSEECNQLRCQLIEMTAELEEERRNVFDSEERAKAMQEQVDRQQKDAVNKMDHEAVVAKLADTENMLAIKTKELDRVANRLDMVKDELKLSRETVKTLGFDEQSANEAARVQEERVRKLEHEKARLQTEVAEGTKQLNMVLELADANVDTDLYGKVVTAERKAAGLQAMVNSMEKSAHQDLAQVKSQLTQVQDKMAGLEKERDEESEQLERTRRELHQQVVAMEEQRMLIRANAAALKEAQCDEALTALLH